MNPSESKWTEVTQGNLSEIKWTYVNFSKPQ